jgi:23S rRNA (uracil1939-C5)-methyltransferase
MGELRRRSGPIERHASEAGAAAGRTPRLETPSLSPGQLVELTVEKAVYQGLGLARLDGQVVFVRRGVPGERVRARVVSVARGYVRAEIDVVLAASSERRVSPCALFARCGGCAHQDMTYGAQLRMKEAILLESLSRAGVPWTSGVPVHPSPEEGWRTRARLHVGHGPSGVRLGLHEEGTHDVVDADVERCLQLSPAATHVIGALREALDRQPRLARAVRHVEIAESTDRSELVLTLETELGPREATALTSLVDGVSGVTGVGTLAGEEEPRPFALMRGSPYVHADVLGKRFRVHARAFFQANRFLVEDLVRAVTDKVPQGGTVLDLYAGVGLFALPLGEKAERVLGAELSATAVEDAVENAARAGLANIRFERADIRKALRSWPAERGEHIVLDPPRTGAGPEVVRAVADRRPATILYVSCHPPTLGRDLKQFLAQGYRLNSLQAFDMFPDTFHLETLALLQPA